MNFNHLMNVAWFTFYQAAFSTLLALLIGIPAAFFCGRRNFPGRKILLSLSVIPFCIPSLIIALGYVTFLGLNGGLNQFLMFIFKLEEPPLRILYSFAGLVIAHGFYNFPLIMKNVADAWEKLPPEPAESARLLGATEGRIFRTVTLHQLMPSIISSSMLVFIYCFLSFILVLLFGGIGNTTLEVEIYKAARATLDFKEVFILSFLETLILCGITTVYCVIEQKAGKLKGITSDNINLRTKLNSFGEKFSLIVLILIIFLFFIMPLAGIVYNGFTSTKTGKALTFATLKRVFAMKSFWPSVKSTVLTAFSTGIFCMLLGFLYSVFLKFKETKNGSKTKVFWKVLPMLPMSISSVVIGVIISLIVKRGNVICLIIAQSLLTWPLAFRVIFPQLNKIPRETMDAATILSKNKFQILMKVMVPFSKRSLISAFGFCFAVSAGDTTLPLVLAIPKFDTLSLFTYRLAGAYRFNEACGAGLILGIICAVIFGISSSLNRRN